MLTQHPIDSNLWLSFHAVAQSTSFSEAAERLHISQPAVSKRIALLETRLGFSLFDRLGSRVILTVRGEQLLPAVTQLKRSLDAVHSLALSEEQPMRGRLALGLSHYCGLHLLSDALAAFSQQFPEVLLDLRFSDSEAIIKAIDQGELALGYATLPPRLHSHVHTTTLWHEQLLPMAAPRHLYKGRQNPHQLGQHLPCILPAAGTSTRNSIEHWLDQQKLQPPAVIEINQLDSIAALAATGVGWTVLPETFISADLVALPIDKNTAATRVLGRIEPTGRAPNPLAHAFARLVTRLGHPSRH